jgi:hypothetical protein
MGHDMIWCEDHDKFEFYPDACNHCNDCRQKSSKVPFIDMRADAAIPTHFTTLGQLMEYAHALETFRNDILVILKHEAINSKTWEEQDVAKKSKTCCTILV